VLDENVQQKDPKIRRKVLIEEKLLLLKMRELVECGS